MARLTTFSKFLITLAIVAALFFLGRMFINSPQGQEILGDSISQQDGNTGSNSSSKAKSSSSGSSDDVIKVGVVTWGGYAGGQYFNEGFEATTDSRFYKEYGFQVEFQVLDDFVQSRNAFRSGDVDLLWATIDAFPTEVNGLSDFDPVVVWQADWSRGGDAIVARRGITSVADLKGKKIAVAELTPSHSFLLWLLEAGGLSPQDVDLQFQANAIDAAAVYKSGKVDAAVVWSPDDIICVNEVPGTKILESTRSAAHIIADVFFAKKKWAEDNYDRLRQLYEGWMIGSAEINTNAASKQKAAKILAREFSERGTALTDADALQMIENVRLVTHGDNKNFFGLNTGYKGIDGEQLYRSMADRYSALGVIEGRVPQWRQIAYPKLVMNTTLASDIHFPEKAMTYSAPTAADEKKEALSTKQVTISFRTAEFKLDENAKYIIDKEFVEIAKLFNNRIRIEGNTDNTGNYQSNKRLSLKRAEAVRDYLVSEHEMDPNRFIVVGNGPDKPVAGNDTDAGRAANRRTDFELIAN